MGFEQVYTFYPNLAVTFEKRVENRIETAVSIDLIQIYLVDMQMSLDRNWSQKAGISARSNNEVKRRMRIRVACGTGDRSQLH